MMNLKKKAAGSETIAEWMFIIAAVLLLGPLLISCGGGGGGENNDPPGEPTFEITDLGWAIENIDMNFWNTPPTEAGSCFISFWIGYEGDDPAADDIADIRFHIGDTDRYWSFSLDDSDLFHPEQNYIGDWYRFRYSTNRNTIPIGNITVEIEMKSGAIHDYTQSIPAPGMTSAASFDYTYTEDYTGAAPNNYAPMLKRATGITGSKDDVNETMTINFSIDDNMAFSGEIIFYSDTAYAGSIDDFVDYETATASSSLNGGAGLFSDGSVNTIEIAATDIEFDNNLTFNDINRFAVIISDGRQYENDPDINTYDCLSVSEKITF